MRSKLTLEGWCRQIGNISLLREWNNEKNAPLTPQAVGSGSHKRVWWKCERGHEWQTEIRVRTGGADCPFCSGRTLCGGNNDLATIYPELAAQWDKEKNASLSPSQVLPGSHRYVWWKCEHGHSWRARIISRSRGSGCPICTGKTVIAGENDLNTLYPLLAVQWDHEKNGELSPSEVTAYSNKRVWWKCSLGHEWQAVIAARTSGNYGCPFCTGKRVLAGFNDLATLYPELAKQWEPELNGSLTPSLVTPGSHKRVWWKCSEGHVWKAVIFSRTGKQKCGCPVCAGKTQRREKYRTI